MDPAIELDPVDVAIVGGGAAGVLVACCLLRAGMQGERVAIVEPAPRLGDGVAYATRRPEHLLNVVAAGLSAFADVPDGFVRFLARQPGAADADADADTLARSFQPRARFGDYLRAVMAAQPGGAAVRWLQDAATSVEPGGAGNLVQLASGGRLRARQVVVALGNPERMPEPMLLEEGVGAIAAWDTAAVAAIGPADEVVILGAGLSMVDAALSLQRNGHAGRITVVSRRGWLPQVHARPGGPAPLPAGLLGASLRERLRWIRERAAARAQAGEPWQWEFDAIRPHGQALWRSLDESDQRRFLRHVVRLWDVHRHRIAPQVGLALAAMRTSGQLQVVPGRAVSIRPVAGACEVVVVPRGSEGRKALRADRIVRALGVEPRVRADGDGLAAALLRSGRARAGPHGLGLSSVDPGFVIGSDGRVDRSLLVTGAMRIGDVWESLAIPELREQARRIAEVIVAAE